MSTKPDQPADAENNAATILDRRAIAPAARSHITSSELLAGRNELFIEHNGEFYTLRLTSKGRLILTK